MAGTSSQHRLERARPTCAELLLARADNQTGRMELLIPQLSIGSLKESEVNRISKSLRCESACSTRCADRNTLRAIQLKGCSMWPLFRVPLVRIEKAVFVLGFRQGIDLQFIFPLAAQVGSRRGDSQQRGGWYG